MPENMVRVKVKVNFMISGGNFFFYSQQRVKTIIITHSLNKESYSFKIKLNVQREFLKYILDVMSIISLCFSTICYSEVFYLV